MRTFFFLPILLINLCCLAKPFENPSTIEVSKDFTTVLLFDLPIDEPPIIGNDAFIRMPNSTNHSKADRMVQLKANTAAPEKIKSNLIVMGKNGEIFEFILIHVKTPNKRIHNIVSSIPYEDKKPLLDTPIEPEVSDPSISYYSKGVTTGYSNGVDTKLSLNDDLYNKDKDLYIETYCQKHSDTKKQIFATPYKRLKISFSVRQVSYDRNLIYLFLTISNKSHLPFERSGDILVRKNVKDSKIESSIEGEEDIIVKPRYWFNIPKKIQGKSKHNFVMVLNKLSIAKEKVIEIDIDEKNGERDLLLKIDSQYINNPVKL